MHVRYAQRKVIPEVRGTDHPSWALVEQCVAPLAVDGRSIVETCTLDLAPVRIDTMQPDAQRWLKTRGLDPQDQFDMFETVIRHDDTVELATDRRGGPPVLRLA